MARYLQFPPRRNLGLAEGLANLGDPACQAQGRSAPGTTTAVFLRHGIAIADVQSHEVLIVDAAGRLRARHGRKGEGPGEYKHLAGIARHGNGLITWDAYHFRVTLLDASGGYVDETRLRPLGRERSRILGAFGNSVLHEISQRGYPGAGAVGPMEIRLPVTYEIARLSDREIVFEATRPGEGEWVAREVNADGRLRHGGLPVIFGRTAVAAVTDRYAYLATTDSITITRYDEAGSGVDLPPRNQRSGAACLQLLAAVHHYHLRTRPVGKLAAHPFRAAKEHRRRVRVRRPANRTERGCDLSATGRRRPILRSVPGSPRRTRASACVRVDWRGVARKESHDSQVP